MNTSDAAEILKQIANLQDTGWAQTKTGSERYGIKDYKRTLYLDFEPTTAYIDTLYQSAPQYTSKHKNVTLDPVSGLHVVTLYASMDSSG
jgi:hypothetical protein